MSRSKLRGFRAERGLSQAKIAEKIGYDRMSYADVENGVREPSARFEKAFRAAFDMGEKEFERLMQNVEK